MIESREHLLTPQFLEKLTPIVEKLTCIVNMGMGTRIGQNTVCSQKMHSFHPEAPEEVHVLQNFDAGQFFYQREEEGRIYHLDIFHQCGLVDHKLIAENIQNFLTIYNKNYTFLYNKMNGQHDIVKADFIDIQTGTGGGRITGELNFGKKLSLRKAHMNHVHLTIMVTAEHLACLFYLVMAVEKTILSCNLELRCNEKIKNIKSSRKQKTDLSAYIDESDSLLKGKNDKNSSISQQDKEDAVDLHYSDKARELKEPDKRRKDQANKSTGGINSYRTVTFGQEGLIDLFGHSVKIEEYGKKFRTYLERQLPEIETHLRKVVREAKVMNLQSGKSKIFEKATSHFSKTHFQYNAGCEEYGELAIGEIINAAARRMVEKKETKFRIAHEDIRYFNKKRKRKVEFCLLIDASSSMEGQRIHVAKLLARYLFFSTNDRISVIFFQHNRAWVQVPFTHDFKQLENSLNEIKAYGETPLALGITACLRYIEQEKARNPFIILITDGVPTLGTVTDNPVYDALQIARKIKENQYGFTCVGLKPHLSYLNQLSKVAGGSIFVAENLEQIGKSV